MWPSIRDGFKAFFTDKVYFQSVWDKWVAKVRGMVMVLGAAIAIPGTDFSVKVEAIFSPTLRPYIGLGLMGVSLMFRAGEKNVKPAEPPQ